MVKRIPLAEALGYLALDTDARQYRNEAAIVRLMNLLERHGQLETVKLCDALKEVVDGTSRLLAMQRLGWTSVLVEFVEVKDQADKLTKGVVVNTSQTKLSPLDVGRAAHLKHQQGMPLDKIAAEFGLNASDVSKLVTIWNGFPEEHRGLLHDGTLGIGVAYEISRLSLRPEQQNELIEAAKAGMKGAEITQEVKRRLAKVKPAKKPAEQERFVIKDKGIVITFSVAHNITLEHLLLVVTSELKERYKK